VQQIRGLCLPTKHRRLSTSNEENHRQLRSLDPLDTISMKQALFMYQLCWKKNVCVSHAAMQTIYGWGALTRHSLPEPGLSTNDTAQTEN